MPLVTPLEKGTSPEERELQQSGWSRGKHL